jgi:hypothetical protein
VRRWVGSTELGLVYEVYAMLGEERARQQSGLARFLFQHLQATRRERAAESDLRRERDEWRRGAIGQGDTPALSVAEVEAAS